MGCKQREQTNNFRDQLFVKVHEWLRENLDLRNHQLCRQSQQYEHHCLQLCRISIAFWIAPVRCGIS